MESIWQTSTLFITPLLENQRNGGRSLVEVATVNSYILLKTSNNSYSHVQYRGNLLE